jgi:hypothetical protein
MFSLGRSAVALAGGALLVLLVVDAVMSMLVAPAPPSEHRQGILLAHVTFHAAVLVLSFVGAGLGFACVRRRLPSPLQAALLGVVFGVASLFGGAVVAVAEGPLLAGWWLLFGSMAFAIGGALLAKPWRAEGHA